MSYLKELKVKLTLAKEEENLIFSVISEDEASKIRLHTELILTVKAKSEARGVLPYMGYIGFVVYNRF